MSVLDPMEVAEVEVWPLRVLESETSKEKIKHLLNQSEQAVLQRAIRQSSFGAVLNEGEIASAEPAPLGESVRRRIISSEAFERNLHPDLRIARRAATIASLAKVVSQRDVSIGLRRALVTQARRMEALARSRLAEAGVDYDEWLRELKDDGSSNA